MDRYNSVNNTKNDFRIAFWKLYQRSPIEKISVSELCRVAGYNRTTFYVYYDNIYDLLLRCIDEMLRPLEEHLGELHRMGAPEEKGSLERLYMTILRTNEKHIHLLIQRHQLYLLEDRVKAIMKPVLSGMYAGNALSNRDLDYILEYQLDAGLGIIAKWFHAQDMSDQEVIHLLIRCSQNGVVSLLSSGDPEQAASNAAARNQEILTRIISDLESQEED